MTEPRKIYIDATAFKQSACLYRFKEVVLEGTRSNEFSPALEFGQAVHKFVAHLRRSNGDFNSANQIATNYYSKFTSFLSDKEFRHMGLLAVTCALYYKHVYKSDIFQTIQDPISKELLIERKFDFLAMEMYPEIDILENNLNVEVHITGTIDEIGIYETGNVIIKDIKTMSSNPYYAQKNMVGYALSVQLMFYKLAIEHTLKLPNVDAFIEAIILDKDQKLQPTFARSPVFSYDAETMEDFRVLLSDKIQQLLSAIKKDKFPKDFTQCNNSITKKENTGLCFLFPICSTSDQELRSIYKQQQFIKTPYNPLLFGEE